jgi:serine/threonine protein kinase
LVTKKDSGDKYACKIIQKDGNMNDAESMATEIEIMKRVRHKHIVTLYELYESSSCMWLILELVDGGDLNYFVGGHHHYSEQVAAHHFKQILEGLHYLHQEGVVHRDIKLDNILIKGDHEYGDVKIADFGLSALIQMNNRDYNRTTSTKRKDFNGLPEMWGTASYFAPEVIDRNYGPQADMWSAGCILFEMLSGTHPFDAESEDELYEMIQNCKPYMGSKSWDIISPEARDLVFKILVVDPKERLSATEALRHPWIMSVGSNTLSKNTKEYAQTKFKERVESRPKEKTGSKGLFGLFKGNASR